MAAAGKPIAYELRTAWTPEEMIRYVVQQGGRFGSLGYKIEQHTPSTAVLARRYTPTAAWALPLAIAAFFFIVGTAAPGATVETAEAAGKVVPFALAAAFILSLVVKSTDRVTFTASAENTGSHVIVSGIATPRLRDYVLGWSAPAALPESALPSTSSR